MAKHLTCTGKLTFHLTGFKMPIESPDSLSDEDYVVFRAKSALSDDPTTAKAWMITAKTLYPNNYSVQFEAYKVEKDAKNIKDAAKCLSDIISKFQQHPELWKEINAMTAALRIETDVLDAENKFLCDMFQHIPLDIQRQILLFTANQCEDTMEHCRLLLLLLKRFPQTVTTHGPNLVDTLMTAEKHSLDENQPVNPFRRLLVCELLPLLGCANEKVELPAKLLYKLLNKAIEFFLCVVSIPPNTQDPDQVIEQPWLKLFSVLELTGRILRWDQSILSFSQTWNKENYWQKLLTFFKNRKTMLLDEHINKQLFYCLMVYFLYCLHEYSNGQSNGNFVLLEAFTDASLPKPIIEPKSSKRKKLDEDLNQPFLTIDKPGSNSVLTNFVMASNCWEMLHSSDIIQREFAKLSNHLKLPWLNNFILDFAMYKGHYEDALVRLQAVDPSHSSFRNLRIACVQFFQRQYTACFEQILLLAPTITRFMKGTFSHNLIVGGTQRHLHFLPLTYLTVLQYCVRLLVSGIKECIKKHGGVYSDLALGSLLVLIQVDWPQQEELLPILTLAISQRGSFHFPLFQKYVVNVEILEELMYLWTPHGGSVSLDIFLTPQSLSSQRRIGTRGADKGVKEDFKQAMKRQVIRSNDPVDQVVMNFLTGEQIHLLQSII